MKLPTPLTKFLGILVSGGLLLMAFFQAAFLLGYELYPRSPFELGLFARLAVLALLVLGAAAVAERARLVKSDVLGCLNPAGAWAAAVMLILRGVGNFHDLGLFKTVHYVYFSRVDTMALSPFCLALGLACLLMLLGASEPN